jgi:hypothetical protein
MNHVLVTVDVEKRSDAKGKAESLAEHDLWSQEPGADVKRGKTIARPLS